MSTPALVLLIFLVIIVLLGISIRNFDRNNTTSAVFKALVGVLESRGEKLQEFRTVKERVQAKIREFEVMTIHKKYYLVKLKGRALVAIDPIEQFTISEEECFVSGKIDPVDLDKYELRTHQNPFK